MISGAIIRAGGFPVGPRCAILGSGQNTVKHRAAISEAWPEGRDRRGGGRQSKAFFTGRRSFLTLRIASFLYGSSYDTIAAHLKVGLTLATLSPTFLCCRGLSRKKAGLARGACLSRRFHRIWSGRGNLRLPWSESFRGTTIFAVSFFLARLFARISSRRRRNNGTTADDEKKKRGQKKGATRD